ncbi:MAG: hypothetical protein KIT73_08610 [Burkholderiales bacterium]|nr:hypothetical protein [Burkholderiales bacterium]
MPTSLISLSSRRMLTAAVLVAGWAGSADAQTLGWAGDPLRDPLWLGSAWVLPVPMILSPCYPFVSCAVLQRERVLERRRERARALRDAPDVVFTPQLPLLRPGKSNDAQIRDDWKGAGQVREEFARSGEELEPESGR